MQTLILGIGNEWAADDGVGPEVVRRVQDRMTREVENQEAGVEFLILARPDVSLLDHFARADCLIVVDAVVSGAQPGALHQETWESGALDSRGVERASSHGFGVREVLEMAAALGKLPPQVELWGVEIASTEPGQGLSPAVTEAVPVIVGELWRVVNGGRL